MKPDKAIEILSEAAFGHTLTLDRDFYDALKLGREALIAILALRAGTPGLDLSILPGETKDHE